MGLGTVQNRSREENEETVRSYYMKLNSTQTLDSTTKRKY